MPSYPIALTDLLKMEDGQTPQAAYSPSSRYNAPAPNATPVAVAHYTPAAMQTPSPARWAPAATPATAAVRATPSPAPMAISPRKKPVDYDTSLVP